MHTGKQAYRHIPIQAHKHIYVYGYTGIHSFINIGNKSSKTIENLLCVCRFFPGTESSFTMFTFAYKSTHNYFVTEMLTDVSEIASSCA